MHRERIADASRTHREANKRQNFARRCSSVRVDKFRLSCRFSTRYWGKMKENSAIESSASPELFYLTRCVWRTYFPARAQRARMQMAGHSRAKFTRHSCTKEREREKRMGARDTVSQRWKKYIITGATGYRVDLAFNGILVSGLCRASSFLSSLSFSLLLHPSFFLSFGPLHFNDDLLNSGLDSRWKARDGRSMESNCWCDQYRPSLQGKYGKPGYIRHKEGRI